ncbi:MAG: hypothetical protein ABSD98_02210 [Candidatus Korobacteraceae bacterium]
MRPFRRESHLLAQGYGYMRAAHDLCDEAGDVATTSLLENWIDQSQRLFEATRD